MYRIFFFISIITLFFYSRVVAQCTGCTTNVTPGVASYTAASGQTLCINSGVNYTGSLILNGGTICNTGTVSNITFLTGSFLNYGTYNGGNLAMSVTGIVNIDNYSSSAFNMGSLVFTAPALNRGMNFRIYKGAITTFTSSITQNGGFINLEVGRSNPGGNPIATSTLNVTGIFTAKTEFSLLVQSQAIVSLSNILSLEGTGVKSVTNYGTITSNNDLQMVSPGSATSTVTINNYDKMFVKSMTANYTAGKVFINNNSASSMTINLSVNLSNATNTLTNNGNITVTSNFNVANGFALNTGTIISNAVAITNSGTLTNNNYIRSNADFLNTISATFNNNKSMLVANTFSNVGTINTATGSIIYTANYYNNTVTSIINGVSSGTDTLLFPRIFISTASQNSGFLNNKLFIYDATLTSTTTNIGYGFDVVSSATRIASTVVWGAKAVAPGNGNPATVNCHKLASMLGVQINASPAGVICAGTPLTLTANFGFYYYTFDANNNPILAVSPITMPGSSFTWNPGGTTGNPKVFTPSSSTSYTVTITYNGCVYTATYNVTVAANTAVIAGAPLINTVINSAVPLNGSVIGGTAPYNYVWTPNAFFVNPPYTNTQQNTQVNPLTALTYTLTITDYYGCVASTTITLIPKPYAHLNKIPDGDYYDVFNNKLLFEFDGQYAQTGLVYKVFKKDNTVIASNITGNIANSLVVNSGDNRYFLDVSSPSILSGYYTLEVTNEKNEKLYLRFKK